MRPRLSLSVITLPLLLASITDAISFDCSKIRLNKKDYDFSKLGGLHSITVEDDTAPPSISNTTWSLDLCANLKKDKTIDKNHQCPSYTRVCGITKTWDPADDPDAEHPVLSRIIPVAGHRDGSPTAFDPSWKKIDLEDSDDKGIELEFNGGLYDVRNQKAVIRLICDKTVSGNEGSKIQARWVDSRQNRDAVARDDDDDDPKDDKKPKQDPNSSLQFVSYGPVDGNDKLDVLRLDWRTKYACEDLEGGKEDDDEGGRSKSDGWGFFTWFILILFLGIATYLIFGSWLNYNRYGARGWDLLPHGDTIRDLPYLFKDWSRNVVDTVTGGHSREGPISV